MKVFIAESNSPDDFFASRLDGQAARSILDASGIEVDYRVAIDRAMLRRSIARAKDISADVFHLSCHGDSTGIRLTSGEDIDWPELARLFYGFARPARILVYASCGGGDVGAIKAFQKSSRRFGWIFGSRHPSGVGYFEACVSWALLYKAISETDLDREVIRRAIDDINTVVTGDFVYRRWDDTLRRYRLYPARPRS